jgi:hypothetical protein
VDEANVLTARGEGGGSMNGKLNWLTSSEELGSTGISQARGAVIGWAEPVEMCESVMDHVNRFHQRQGLTLVHFSTQLERCLWDRGCA